MGSRRSVAKGRVLGSVELDETGAARRRLAVPRHPDAHRVRAELALPAHDAERVARPLERVVVDADEQLPRRRVRPGQPDQSDGETEPRKDCRKTRHPVAHTVRR